MESSSVFMVKNLKFKDILDIPELSVHKPITCIIGASGSGKTTLLRMFNGLNIPDAGCVLYNGEDIAALDKVKLRREVVMLGQTPVIYSGSVEDNLQIGRLFSEKEPASIAAMISSTMEELVSYPFLRENNLTLHDAMQLLLDIILKGLIIKK